MTAPLYSLDLHGPNAALLAGLLLGIAFGFVLERGGLGDPKKLVGQFHLTDLTVFKVMFSAILTAAVGLFWLARAGFLDLNLIAVPPTYLLPQLAGGLIFGVGFVTAGLCPGTSCVAAASGRADGLAVLAGILVGIFGFGELLEPLGAFVHAGARGRALLPASLGLQPGLTLILLGLLALAGFLGAEAIERRGKDDAEAAGEERGARPRRLWLVAAVALLLAPAAFVGAGDARPGSRTLPFAGGSVRLLPPLELAKWIVDKRGDYRLLDIVQRDESSGYRLPFAEPVDPDSLVSAVGEDTGIVVLYARDASPPRTAIAELVARSGAEVWLLEGGLEAWGRDVLFPDLRGPGLDDAEIARRARLSRHFGGDPALPGGDGPRTPERYLREGC